MKLYSKDRAVSLIASMIRRNRVCRSLILTGEKGVGKRTLALYMAMQLLCEEQNGIPCGVCKSCRMAQKNAHPDIIWVSPSGKSENFKVDDLRPIVSDASVAPNEGRLKIYIIPGIDKALPAAQNILLKIFEEPPEHVAFIMTAEASDRVLETIRSRAIVIDVPPADRESCLSALRDSGVPAEKAELAYSVCGGNIGRCLEHSSADDDGVLLAVKAAASAIASGNEYSLGKSLFLADREAAVRAMQELSELIADCCLIKQGAKPKSCFSQEAELIAKNVRLSGLSAMYESISEAIVKLRGNCSVQLTCQNLSAQLARYSH